MTEAPASRDPATPPVDPASILVAIPALNEARHIQATLRDLFADAAQMEAVKVVVADGGSIDQTCAIVKAFAQDHPNVHVIDNPERLQAAAVNKVVATCAEPHHEILIRVDAHSHYPAGYVLDVAESLTQHDAAVLATVMDSMGESCFQRGAAWASDSKLGSGGSGHRGGTKSGYVDHGHHAGFSLKMWRKVGGYNTQFVANEDAEFDHRIGQAGGRIWLDATIRIGYLVRNSLSRLGLQYWRYGKGRAQTVRLHRLRPRLRQMVPPAVVLINLLSLLLALFVPEILLLPLVYLALLLGAAIKLARQHQSFCALWAMPALFVMHHAWGAGFLFQNIFGRGIRL